MNANRKKVVVVGAGLVGGTIAADLAIDFDVTAIDICQKNLNRVAQKAPVRTILADARNQDLLASLLEDTAYAVNAVPGWLGFKTLETIISKRVNAVDIAFMPEDVLLLNKLAVNNNTIVISDMGVAPGMSNLLAGYATILLDKCESLEILVGGLPKVRTWPWSYKAVFSPADVIEEYLRPARLVRNGKIITMPALSDSELVDFETVGTLEAFNSDGLRSLVHTLSIPEMVEKTMRYPGHIELIKALRHSGFFEKEPVMINDILVEPIEFTSRLLFNQWQLNDGEPDITVMRVTARGLKNGKTINLVWELFDEYDNKLQVHSMARTTGYAATAALRMMDTGLWSEPGIHVPENIGMIQSCVEYLLREQANKGVIYKLLQQE